MMPLWFVLSTTLVGGIDLLTSSLRLEGSGRVQLLQNMPTPSEDPIDLASVPSAEILWSLDSNGVLAWSRTEEYRIQAMDEHWWSVSFRRFRPGSQSESQSRLRLGVHEWEKIWKSCPGEAPSDSCRSIREVTRFDDGGRRILVVQSDRTDSTRPWGIPDTLLVRNYDSQGRLLHSRAGSSRTEIVRDAQGSARQRIEFSAGQTETTTLKPGPGEDTVYVSSYKQEPQALVRWDSQGRIVTMLGNGGRYLSEGIWFWNDSVAVQWGSVFPVSACRYALESRPGPWQLVACDRWDPQGHILEEYESSPWFNRTSSWFYMWDANGRWIRKSRIDSAGDTLQKIERRYEEGSVGIFRHSVRPPRTPRLTKVGDHLELGPVFDRQKVTIRSLDGKLRFQCALESGTKITLPVVGQGVWVISGTAPTSWSMRFVTDR